MPNEEDLKDTTLDEAAEELDETGQPSEEEKETSEEEKLTDEISEEMQEDVAALKERLAQVEVDKAKAERDRDNYRKENEKYRVQKRELPIDVEEKPQDPEEDEIDRRVNRVLAKREQRTALANVLDPKSDDYIQELTDKDQYREILGYLPQSYDRTSASSVKRALKVATAAWKFDRGITERKPNPKTEMTDTGLGGGDSMVNPRQPEPILNIPKSVPMSEWFK